MATYKLAGRKRPRLPKILQGAQASDSDANRHDGIDCVQEAKLFRGINSEYAIPRDAINADLRSEGSPIIRLTGDEFCQTAESLIALLEDLSVQVGGIGPFTNNNGVTFVRETEDDESPLYEELVANLASASNQHLSIPTASALEVGTGSFIASIQFKSNTIGVYQKLFDYGSAQSGKGYYRVHIDTAGRILCGIKDTSNNSASITDSISNRFLDGRIHTVTMLVDRTVNLMYLFCDGQLIGSTSISGVTATLDTVGENFYIGTGKDSAGNLGSYFNGRLANFHLIKAADYNAVKVLAAGIRERVTVGTFVTPTNDSAKRFNNKFGIGANANDYSTTMIDVEDGEYEIQTIYEQNTGYATMSIQIDDNEVNSITMAGSATENVRNSKIGVKLGTGKHILKLKVTGAGASEINFVNILKRKGHENGGATEFLLLGDEIMQRQNAAWPTNLAVATADDFNNRITEDTAGDYTEGDLFLRGGLWEIQMGVREDTTNAGKIDLDFGSVEVFDQLATNASTKREACSCSRYGNTDSQNSIHTW
jgi:hypothetical protein